ncbi:MAG TPA: hypothetical protein VFC65_03155 [Prolixibacteraceae bacterium]|nr:hypothetical protein [Prolixibacteraceae bacterium]
MKISLNAQLKPTAITKGLIPLVMAVFKLDHFISGVLYFPMMLHGNMLLYPFR